MSPSINYARGKPPSPEVGQSDGKLNSRSLQKASKLRTGAKTWVFNLRKGVGIPRRQDHDRPTM